MRKGCDKEMKGFGGEEKMKIEGRQGRYKGREKGRVRGRKRV